MDVYYYSNMINLTKKWNMIPDIFQIFLYIHITYNSNYYILKIDILRYTYINVRIILQ